MLPGNVHRTLSAYQVAWPMKTRRNPYRSLLRALAAAARAEADTMQFRIDYAEQVEQLDEWLEHRVGPRWPEEFERYRTRRQ
jgi:hypothetical protein